MDDKKGDIKRRERAAVVPCPDCKAPMKQSKSDKKTPIFIEFTYHCTACAGVMVWDLTASRRLSPPAKINQDIQVPFSRHVDVQGLLNFLEKGKTA